ncbi:CRAL/TRIO domain protein [Lepidopterella palustris CBS 459.81]|uniref:CRAL/TRIO domain protein n=1 Tax=Lepidopterella palustris CBS 459.81 TaxID=1314670 RepID=A0A8E2JG50_9PEZI|nr:CRAL/TRIO domain protein [Lepidopterella palustris CBS 459.81]
MSTAVAEPTASGTNPDAILNEKTLLTTTTRKAGDASSEMGASSIDSKSIREADPKSPSAEPAGPVKRPLTNPAPNCNPTPRAPLTADQQAKYKEVLATVSAWTEIPTTSSKNAPNSPITEDERLWLTRECILRYLRATKWHTTAASKRLMETLVWRREYGIAGFTADYISPENVTGKQVIFGFDNEGRPCLYLNPNKQNTKQSERQIHHLVFMLERVIELMAPGQETEALLINFKESSARSNPSVGTGKHVLNILQNHYPERLGRALITHLPWYVTTFFKLISPFIDPVTKSKMKFNEPLTDHVPASQLIKTSGGDVDFVYDHEVYWPALNALCDQRRREYRERWESAGKHIGESEVYLKGGDEGSVGVELKVEATE